MINNDALIVELQNQIIFLQNELNEHIEREEKYRSAIDHVKEVIFQADEKGFFTFLNSSWEEITGFTVKETIGTFFLNYIYPDDREVNIQLCADLMARKKEFCRHEIRYCHKSGGFRWIEVYAKLVLQNNEIIGISGSLNDITDRKNMELELEKYKNHLEELVFQRTNELEKTNKQLQHLATHDSLTNIPNRYLLEEELKLAALNSQYRKSSLLFIDLDNFKVINDSFGHSTGDKVLIGLTKNLKKSKRPNDFLARLGGDEFAILLKDTNLEEAKLIAENIRSQLDESEIHIHSPRVSLNLTASIGVVEINGSLTPQELLAYADTALYAAKDAGKNRIVSIGSYSDKDKMSKTNKIVSSIKFALKENKFLLYYQPVHNINNGILHYEALIRMVDNHNKIIPPCDFISVAERFGLMSQIDRWVLNNTIQTLQKRPDMKIFMNLSGVSIGDKALLKFIEESIINSAINPQNIGFEITETIAIKDLEQSERWIKQLKNLGCRFALDDFGAGFSSFSYLSKLPIDYLKIDGSFVKDLDKDNNQRDLIQAVNAVAHALGKETIAEFVENEQILQILRELNVNHGQGYYLGKPGPLE